METSRIRRIGNWSNTFSCEVLALIRHISFVGYGVLGIITKLNPKSPNTKIKQQASKTSNKIPHGILLTRRFDLKPKSDVHDRWDKLEESYNEIFSMMRSFCKMVIQRKQAANVSTYTPEPSRHYNYEDDDDDEECSIPLKDMPQISPSIALAPVSSITEPDDSLIMGNEELSTIPKKELDEFIKSSIEDLIPIPRDSEDTSGSDSENVFTFEYHFPPTENSKKWGYENSP
ncbi:hypothetical protein Tco_0511212 [Tanacetum coccineum]